jgi:hypothetical protein
MAGSKGAAKAAKAARDDSEQEPLKIQNLGDMAQIKRVLDETAVAVRVFSHLSLLRSPKRGARTICARTTHAIRASISLTRSSSSDPYPLSPSRRAKQTQAVLDMGYDERHLVTDSKIALGLLAVGLALAAQFYPAPYPENKTVLAFVRRRVLFVESRAAVHHELRGERRGAVHETQPFRGESHRGKQRFGGARDDAALL